MKRFSFVVKTVDGGTWCSGVATYTQSEVDTLVKTLANLQSSQVFSMPNEHGGTNYFNPHNISNIAVYELK